MRRWRERDHPESYGYPDEYGWSDGYGTDAYRTGGSDPGYDPYAENRPRAGLLVRGGRVLSGVVCGAVLVLTVVVGVAGYLAGDRGFPGPGIESLAAHVTAAVVAVVAQVTADRARGALSLAAAVVVIVTASILMFTQWWG